MLFLLTLIAILLIGSAFCSSSEAALLSVSKNTLQVEVDKGTRAAKSAMEIKSRIGESIGTITILNNIFNIVGTLVVGSVAQALFNDWQFAVFSAILTGLLILFGEILAKNLGERYALQQMLAVAGLIKFLRLALYPLIWLLEKITLFVFGQKTDTKISEEEIKVMVEQSVADREIEKDEHQIIHNVFKLNDKCARDIMTPRVNIYALKADETIEAQQEQLLASTHSRLPIYSNNFDQIEGFVLLDEALKLLVEDKGDILPSQIKKDLLRVQETTQVDSLLVIFQRSKRHIALVVDEFDGTSGIVTLEDVLEELVGEIVDETDYKPDMREVPVKYAAYLRA